MIPVCGNIAIQESEIQLDFIRSSGPGGQNVNKVSSGVQLRFDVAHSPSLPEEVRQRLMQLAGSRLTKEGVLVIEAQRYRTQDQNRQDAILRLVHLIRQAARRPKSRRPTRPTAGSKRQRLEEKRRRGAVKRMRRPVTGMDE